MQKPDNTDELLQEQSDEIADDEDDNVLDDYDLAYWNTQPFPKTWPELMKELKLAKKKFPCVPLTGTNKLFAAYVLELRGGTYQPQMVVEPPACATAGGGSNALDDDCDGETDEGFETLGEPCLVAVGVCEETGLLECGPDGQLRCSARAPEVQAEVCDNGLDDNCDGATDEGCKRRGRDGGGCGCRAGENGGAGTMLSLLRRR